MTDGTIDWATGFDHFSPEYAADPYGIWAGLRERGIWGRGDAYRGMWVPVTHEDVCAVANDVDLFSSRSPVVASYGSAADFGLEAPPISSDPPYHTEIRRMLLPFFAPGRIDELAPKVEALANELIDGFEGAGSCDAALDYARHIPVRVIATMLGVPPEDDGKFFEWVHTLLEVAPADFGAAVGGLIEFFGYFTQRIEERRAEPADDLISFLVGVERDERPLEDKEILGMCLLLLLAGIDTTWSAIGASIWHLAQHPEQQRRLADEPELWPTAIEELLRAYSPVTMAREVTTDAEFAGCPVRAGDPLLLPFPSANRDPAVFPDPDEVVLDRLENRHVAFGVGIHRCLGSNLARMEVGIAVRTFLERMPEFSLADPDAVTWSVGQVRGPRTLPVSFG